ncbi:hypothetical protein RR48_00573 [Papilio machaon]|uniref:Tyrosine-protein phosphatase domain-containing protein n=1 Tax=Papilio machaon TaxID=76193 RepID=A0A0N0PFL4_PAPMA|nr:hypothetical protein RR48_00573 [Papilio machaon]
MFLDILVGLNFLQVAAQNKILREERSGSRGGYCAVHRLPWAAKIFEMIYTLLLNVSLLQVSLSAAIALEFSVTVLKICVNIFRLPSNLSKNRYTDVLCYDHSRVLLSQTDPEDPTTDYINANYVDGYKQKNAFICTQGQ